MFAKRTQKLNRFFKVNIIKPTVIPEIVLLIFKML